MRSIIGQWMGWRVTFGVIGVVALMIMFALYRLLPILPSLFSGSLRTLPKLLRQPTLVGLYCFTFLILNSHYTAYSYIEPFVKEVGLVSEGFTTFLLLLFGCAGILGSVIFSYLGERANTKLLLGHSVAVMLCMALLQLTVTDHWAISTVLVIWGMSLMVVSLAMQVKVLNIDNDASDMIMSMFSGIINLGIGAGALIGAKVIHGAALTMVGYAGTGFAVCALLFIIWLLKKYPVLR